MISCQVCATPLPDESVVCHVCGSQLSPGGLEQSPGTRVSHLAEEFLERLQSAVGGEYVIEREIGRGGMGIVYLARELALDRHVALKVLPPALAYEERVVERFVREARLAARLDHPNIIPIHRVGRAGDFTFFLMKYVAGGSLQALLQGTPRLTLAETQRILVACANALEYAHTHGVIHRDVKPANILLDAGGRLYVTDFGIAKAVSAETPLTRSGAVVGTPLYMSPEQCRGLPADARSDQYALAMVGYQMLSGQLPFEGRSMEGIMYERLFTEPAPLEEFRPDVPRAIREAIHRALRRESAERFPSMAAFAEALTAGAAVANAEATRTVAVTVPERRTPRTPLPGVEERARALVGGRRARLWIPVGVLGALGVAAGIWFATRPAPVEREIAPATGAAGTPSPETTPPGTTSPDAGLPATTPPSRGEGAPAERGAKPPPVAAFASWRLAAPLPARARLAMDDRSSTATEGQLEPGQHTVAVSAPGYELWRERRRLTAGDTWDIRPRLRPIARKEAPGEATPREPAGAPPARPEPPSILLSSIESYVQGGLNLHNRGEYVEAAKRYREGLAAVADAERSYRSEGALSELKKKLAAGLERTIAACEQERQIGEPVTCPEP